MYFSCLEPQVEHTLDRGIFSGPVGAAVFLVRSGYCLVPTAQAQPTALHALCVVLADGCITALPTAAAALCAERLGPPCSGWVHDAVETR